MNNNTCCYNVIVSRMQSSRVFIFAFHGFALKIEDLLEILRVVFLILELTMLLCRFSIYDEYHLLRMSRLTVTALSSTDFSSLIPPGGCFLSLRSRR